MKLFRVLCMVVVLVGLCACMSGKSQPRPLRVGVTPNYPPIIMMQGDRVAGVECDFATQLALEWGCPLQLKAVPWELQLEELEAGRLDMVMSGMTVTPARQTLAAFCDPYMDNPLVAVVRRGEAGRYASATAILESTGGVGVLLGTSGDAFARSRFKYAKVLPLSSRDDVAFYLMNQRIDLYVDDLAAVVQIAARHEARLELVLIPLESQHLAWAVRLGDEELLQQANASLARWTATGQLEQMLTRWMPYRTGPATKPKK